jgi:hypothetical protein
MFRSNPKENWGCHGYLCTVQTLVHPRPKNVQILFWGGRGRRSFVIVYNLYLTIVFTDIIGPCQGVTERAWRAAIGVKETNELIIK